MLQEGPIILGDDQSSLIQLQAVSGRWVRIHMNLGHQPVMFFAKFQAKALLELEHPAMFALSCA